MKERVMQREQESRVIEANPKSYNQKSISGILKQINKTSQFTRIITLEDDDPTINKSRDIYLKTGKNPLTEAPFGDEFTSEGVLGINEHLMFICHGLSTRYLSGTPKIFIGEDDDSSCYSAAQFASMVSGMGIIPNNYTGQIFINGCYTAMTFNERTDKGRRYFSFISDFKSELITLLADQGITFRGAVYGNLGAASTTKDGREISDTLSGKKRPVGV